MKLIGSRITVLDPLSIDALMGVADMISDRLDDELRDVIEEAAERVAKRAKQGISRGPKTGRRYKRGKTRWHQASAPGEYPASDTGNLVRSIHVVRETDGIKSYVASDAEYAAALEYKPKEKGGRPYLRRALAEVEAELIDDVFSAVFRAF